MKAKTLCSMLLFAVATVLAGLPFGLSAKTLGMVANDGPTPSVTVFDGDTHAVLGTVSIPPGPATGDVFITPDLRKGFVTNFDHKVFVIDLTSTVPVLAGGTNPISISNAGEDLSISPDGKFLTVTDGSDHEPVSVINIATQAEISTFSTGADSNSVDVCSDGSVLVTSDFNFNVRRFTLSGTGTLTDTGEVLSGIGSEPMNVYCAPGAKSGVVFEFGGRITSFTIPGLSVVDVRTLSGLFGISGAINPAGNRVFVRGNAPGAVDVFAFTSATGTLGASPLLTFPVAETTAQFGMDQMAVHPNGTKLFVSERAPGAVNVYDPSTGALLASITDPAIVAPTGVTVATESDPCAGSPPPGAIVGNNGPNILNGTPGNDKIFGLGGPDIINGGGGNDLICGGSGPDVINGGPGNDILNTKDGVNGNDVANGGAGNNTCVRDPGDVCSP